MRSLTYSHGTVRRSCHAQSQWARTYANGVRSTPHMQWDRVKRVPQIDKLTNLCAAQEFWLQLATSWLIYIVALIATKQKNTTAALTDSDTQWREINAFPLATFPAALKSKPFDIVPMIFKRYRAEHHGALMWNFLTRSCIQHTVELHVKAVCVLFAYVAHDAAANTPEQSDSRTFHSDCAVRYEWSQASRLSHKYSSSISVRSADAMRFPRQPHQTTVK